MEFDQSFSGVADWGFPSPTATPTTGSFSNTTIQTPKTATFPSHFQDAFDTPQMHGYGTPQQPMFSSATPMQRPQSSSETLRSNYYAAVQAQNGAQNMNTSVQYAHAQEMPSNGVYANMAQPSPQHMTFTQCDSTQMQTPPPTRGTSVKKPQLVQNVAFGTPSTIASRRFMTPQQHVLQSNAPMHQQQTPMQFPMLQLSPDMQHFGNMGPMTAPVHSQTQGFWEVQPSPVGDFVQTPPVMLDDPFGLNASHQHPPWTSNVATPQQHQGAQTMGFNTPAMNSFAVQQVHSRPASAAAVANHNVPSYQPTHSQTSSGVNPSLLYSSPAQSLARDNNRAIKVRPTMEQVDLKRRDSAVPSLTTPTSGARPMLRRCNTTGNARPRSSASSVASTDSLSTNNSLGQAARPGSPLKRVGVTPLDSISEAMKPRVQRPSVVLTIDENGLARAVPQASTSPTKSVRERYPGLFDSDSSDGESIANLEPASRNPSFSFTKGEERNPKIARLDTPVENLDGISLPRSSSSASLRVHPSRAAVAAAAQLKRQGSTRKLGSLRSKKPLQKSTSYNSMIDTCPMDFGEQSVTGANSTASQSPDENQSFIFNRPPTDFSNVDMSQNASNGQNIDWGMYTMAQSQTPQQSFQAPQQTQIIQQQQQAIRIRCPTQIASISTQRLDSRQVTAASFARSQPKSGEQVMFDLRL
ncbi:hypothetical protein Q7P35_002091 [Cladosporium inversicolor]